MDNREKSTAEPGPRVTQSKDDDSESTASQMDPELARQLFYRGATLLLLDMPEGSQFGIDSSAWRTGTKFRGIKMIPPGVHFIYYSAWNDAASAPPRIGFFHNFSEKEFMVRRWDQRKEDVSDDSISDEDLERYRSDLESLDPHLGPYPYEEAFRYWFSLTSHITGPDIERLQPVGNGGRITSQCDLITKESSDVGYSSSVDKSHPERKRYTDKEGLPIMFPRPGTEIRFSVIPSRDLSEHSSIERTSIGMDSSQQLTRLIDSVGSEQAVLAEIQFAFICFIIGQQWKRLVHIACSCEDALVSRPDFYDKLTNVLFYQLKHIPSDFFVDIVTKNNFLISVLSNFFTLIQTTYGVAEPLIHRSKKFKHYLQKKFKWDFSQEPEEYRPTVVDLTEKGY